MKTEGKGTSNPTTTTITVDISGSQNCSAPDKSGVPPTAIVETRLAVACNFCSRSIGHRIGTTTTSTTGSPSSPQGASSKMVTPNHHHLPPHLQSAARSTTSSSSHLLSSRHSLLSSQSGQVDSRRMRQKSSSDTDGSGGDSGIDTCNCRKPRARCALCLSRLNTSASLSLFQPNVGGSRSNSWRKNGNDASSTPTTANKSRNILLRPKRPFSSFTVFCATCRHSGHALHYLEWFRINSNCPVAGCTCTCSSLDSSLRIHAAAVESAASRNNTTNPTSTTAASTNT